MNLVICKALYAIMVTVVDIAGDLFSDPGIQALSVGGAAVRMWTLVNTAP